MNLNKITCAFYILAGSVFFFTQNTFAQRRQTGLVFTDKKTLDQVDNAKPHLYASVRGAKMATSFDLTPGMPPVGNQGQQGSCACWATAYAVRSCQEKVEQKWEITNGGQIIPNRIFSPAYIYNQVNKGKDAGSYFTDVFKVLQEKGCATLASAPYVEKDYLSPPSQQSHNEAQNFKIAWAKDIPPAEVGTIKSYIVQGYPIIIGATIDSAFEYLKPNQIIKSMGPGGCHALVVVGYDDNKEGGCFKIMNSWGVDWGTNGFCWMTYDVFAKCVAEAWLVEDAPDPGKSVDPVDVVYQPVDNNTTNIDNNDQQTDIIYQPVGQDTTYIEDADDANETFDFNDEVAANVDLDSVWRDYQLKGFESYGPGILLHGYIDVAENAGDSATVVVYITKEYNENEALFCSDSYFSDVNGAMVCPTATYNLKVFLDADGQYFVFFPNRIIKASGEKTVLAIPILYLDGVDVAHGEAVIVDLD